MSTEEAKEVRTCYLNIACGYSNKITQHPCDPYEPR